MNKERMAALRDIRRTGSWVKLDFVASAIRMGDDATLAYLRAQRIDVKERGGAYWVRGFGSDRLGFNAKYEETRDA